MIAIFQVHDLAAVKPAQRSLLFVVCRADQQELVGCQYRLQQTLTRLVKAAQLVNADMTVLALKKAVNDFGFGVDFGPASILVLDLRDFFVAEVFGRYIENDCLDPHVGIAADQDDLAAFFGQATADLQDAVVGFVAVPVRWQRGIEMVYSDSQQTAFVIEQYAVDQVAFRPQLVDDPADFAAVGAAVVRL